MSVVLLNDKEINEVNEIVEDFIDVYEKASMEDRKIMKEFIADPALMNFSFEKTEQTKKRMLEIIDPKKYQGLEKEKYQKLYNYYLSNDENSYINLVRLFKYSLLNFYPSERRIIIMKKMVKEKIESEFSLVDHQMGRQVKRQVMREPKTQKVLLEELHANKYYHDRNEILDIDIEEFMHGMPSGTYFITEGEKTFAELIAIKDDYFYRYGLSFFLQDAFMIFDLNRNLPIGFARDLDDVFDTLRALDRIKENLGITRDQDIEKLAEVERINKVEKMIQKKGLFFSKKAHEIPKSLKEILKKQKIPLEIFSKDQGFLINFEKRLAIYEAIEQDEDLVKINRVFKGMPGQKLPRDNKEKREVTELEKKLNLEYSVIIDDQKNAIALFRGKEDKNEKDVYIVGKGKYNRVKFGQRLNDGKWVAIRIQEEEEEYKEKRDIEFKMSKEASVQLSSAERETEPGMKKYYSVDVLFEGRTVDELLNKNSSFFLKDIDERLNIALLVAENLKLLHDKNIIHGDLHPGNMIYNPDSDLKSLGIIDFGASRPIPEGSEFVFQGKGLNWESPHAAPEVTREGHFSKASDIYALGYVYMELFSRLDIRVMDSLIKMMREPNVDNRKILKIDDVIETVKKIINDRKIKYRL